MDPDPDPWAVELLGSDDQRVTMELLESPRWDQRIRLTHGEESVEIGVENGAGLLLDDDLPEWAEDVARQIGVPEVR